MTNQDQALLHHRVLIRPDLGLAEHQRYVFLEFDPMRTLVTSGDDLFEVNLPYLIFAVNILSLYAYVWCRPARATQPDAQLYIFPFPHTSDDGRICYYPGDAFPPELRAAVRVGEQLEEFGAECMRRYLAGDNKYFLSSGKTCPSALAKIMAEMKVESRTKPKDRAKALEWLTANGYSHRPSRYEVKNFLTAWETLTPEQVLALDFAESVTLDEAYGMVARRVSQTWHRGGQEPINHDV